MFKKVGGHGHQFWNQLRLKAMWVPEVGSEAKVSDDKSEEVSDTGEWNNEFQWELATEGEASLHSHEEAQQLNKISIKDILSEPDDDDCLACVQTIREKAVSIPKENLSRVAMHSRSDCLRHSKPYESHLMSDMGIGRVDLFTLVNSGNTADTISSKWR